MPPNKGNAGRTVLICHENEPLNCYGLARWLASFTELAAIVVIREPKARLWRRIKREVQRVGIWRFADVLAFRVYSRIFLAPTDRQWTTETLRNIEARFPPLPSETRIVYTASPNSSEIQSLLEDLRPDMILARCKNILREQIFRQASIGTFVMHPGICPEYRNAHGCFWALARRDMNKVGMTLLRVDPGVDTGPVYGYYTCDYDEVRQSHTIIQNRVVFDNLDALEAKFKDILTGVATTINTAGRKSQAWGQPWLSQYLHWKRLARSNSR